MNRQSDTIAANGVLPITGARDAEVRRAPEKNADPGWPYGLLALGGLTCVIAGFYVISDIDGSEKLGIFLTACMVLAGITAICVAGGQFLARTR